MRFQALTAVATVLTLAIPLNPKLNCGGIMPQQIEGDLVPVEYERVRGAYPVDPDRVFNFQDVMHGEAGRSEILSIGTGGNIQTSLGVSNIFSTGAATAQKRTILEYQSEDGRSQALTIFLAVVDGNLGTFLNYPGFLIEWGSGGAKYAAAVDAWPGTKINLVASYVRVSAVALNAIAGPIQYIFTASIGFLPSVNVGKSRWTIPLQNGSPQILFIPPFSESLYFQKLVPGDSFTVGFQDEAGTTVYDFTLGAGVVSQELPILGMVNHVTVTRTVGAGSYLLRWNLVL